MIRIFVNNFGLQAFAVREDDLFSVRVPREQFESSRGPIGSLLSPPEFRLIGCLKEKTQVTFRYLQDGATKVELPLPENIIDLGFDFEE